MSSNNPMGIIKRGCIVMKLDLLTKIGIVSFVTTLIGLYLLGEMNAWCHIIFIVSYVGQIYIFYKTKQWFLIIQMISLTIFAVINYVKWIGGN
jgi:hypothetical protein